MLNRIVITGRLTRDPEHRTTKNNVSTASFTIAVDDTMKGPDGEKTTSYINVVVWNAQADSVAKSLRKGALVGVDGRIRQRTWEKRDGTGKASTIEIIANQVEFLEPRKKDIPNEDFGYQSDEEDDSLGLGFDEELDNKSKNLDAIDPTDDNMPF